MQKRTSVKYIVFNHWKIFYEISIKFAIFRISSSNVSHTLWIKNRFLNTGSYHSIAVFAVLIPSEMKRRVLVLL